MKSNFYKAELETHHFSFETYGNTEQDALRLMQNAWAKHRKFTGATMGWNAVRDDVNVERRLLGAAYRDGELL